MSRPIEEIHSAERSFYDRKESDVEVAEDVHLDRDGTNFLKLIGLGDALREKKALECACGGGRLASFLATRGADVSAFDISPKSVKKTARRALANGVQHRVHAAVATFEDMPRQVSISSWEPTSSTIFRTFKPSCNESTRFSSRAGKRSSSKRTPRIRS